MYIVFILQYKKVQNNSPIFWKEQWKGCSNLLSLLTIQKFSNGRVADRHLYQGPNETTHNLFQIKF